MIEKFYTQAADSQRLRHGPLGPHIDGFASLLAEQGYSRQAGKQNVRLAGDLSQWLEDGE